MTSCDQVVGVTSSDQVVGYHVVVVPAARAVVGTAAARGLREGVHDGN